MNEPLPSTIPDQLPDFRNFGVVLRILLSVLLVAGLLAMAQPTEPLAYFLDTAVLLAPALLLSLGLLALLSPWLHRLSYRFGVLGVMLLSAAACQSVRWVLADLLAAAPSWRSLGMSLLLSWALLGYFRLRGRALSPLLTEARLQALQARIRPHFLFNSLNAVLSLIRSEPRKAEHALEDLADLFRVFMADNRDLSTLKREVALVRQYLGIEALRLGSRLQVEWHIDNMPLDAAIPPLTLQPLLENAVYHGIEPASTPGIITINIYRARDELHIDLRNPFHPREGQHRAGNKMAMGNIRERLALHFDAEASLKTTVGADYYQVHLTLPYRPMGTT